MMESLVNKQTVQVYVYHGRAEGAIVQGDDSSTVYSHRRVRLTWQVQKADLPNSADTQAATWTPAPTIKATPAPTIKATPAPTIKATPAPTIKATPAPTTKATPAPTTKATPAPTPKCPNPTESHKVHVPHKSVCKNNPDKNDKLFDRSIACCCSLRVYSLCDIAEVIVDLKKDKVIIRFDLDGVMDSTGKKQDSPGSGSKIKCKGHPGSPKWPMPGVDTCDQDDDTEVITIDIKQFKGCGYRFLVCANTPNNSWMKGDKDEKDSGCCVTVTIPAVPGSACQDPHFTGFDGVKYDFHGIDNKVFNLISAPAAQLNALFAPAQAVAGQTFMTEMGFRTTAGDRILVKATEFGKLSVNLNGEDMLPLPEGSELVLRSATKVGLLRRGLGNGETVVITTPDMRVRIFSPEWDQAGEITIVHLNLAVEVLNAGVSMHGVLGQTYAKAATTASSITNENAVDSGYADYHTEIQGKAEDYLVADLFASEFAFNMFASPGMTVQGTTARRSLRA
ncbi:hypothetical protein WJX72_002641 [[Myrmecia] bisecta]|uniref:VWFD domain-containing protein n=1 Tax=[Myrmecia] bisecta TaxID=41462 RepID=A0AAW1R5X1_9CHLO